MLIGRLLVFIPAMDTGGHVDTGQPLPPESHSSFARGWAENKRCAVDL
jgi:hypothetical protein